MARKEFLKFRMSQVKGLFKWEKEYELLNTLKYFSGVRLCIQNLEILAIKFVNIVKVYRSLL
jgi:hypothetical protein